MICAAVVHTMNTDYVWDPNKAMDNRQKHGVDFADAVGVFEDEWALTVEDLSATGERRWVTIGVDFLERLLVIIYTYRGSAIRLISARPATRRERVSYEQRGV